MLEEIRQELERVVGARGVEVQSDEPGAEGEGRRVRVETEQARWRMDGAELLRIVRGMSDKAGVASLREEVERLGTTVEKM